MRILIDTNVFIYREDDRIVPENLQNLLRILNGLKAEMLVHPKSVEEINRDPNENRKNVVLSKINTYLLLELPPDPNKDKKFLDIVGQPSKPNDYADNVVLYAVYKDAVDFLITEDRGIHNKAIKLNIKDRVLSIGDGIETFEMNLRNERVSRPPALKKEFIHNLNVKDSFFDSLKEEYGKAEFEDWFKRISKEGRKCWVYFREDGTVGALLIYKVENEPIDSTPSFPAKRRLKISTFKATYVGYKIGELFIKLSVEYSIKNNLAEMYLTHFTKPNDDLVNLIAEYGFNKVAYKMTKNRKEDLYLKEVLPLREKLRSLSPSEISKNFWPNFYDERKINKFIIPIRPEYHERLFTEYKIRQTTLLEHAGGFIVAGNTIKKAYLCHSKITKVSPGDILLFYRSQDRQELTSLGIVEEVHPSLQDKDKIVRLVGRRTVYSIDEIADKANKPTMVILFTWHFHLANPLKLDEMKRMNVLTAAPQSIIQISHEKYLMIKKRGEIDERFTVS